LVWMTRPVPAPRVTRIVKITNDGLTKQRFVNDGSRLYYAAGARDTHMRMFQVSLKGGEPLLMPRLTGMLPLAISPDRSEMLLGQILQGAVNVGTVDGPFPIWVADTLGNAPRRWGGIVAQEISWSPKGDEILYSNGPELRIARGDGSQSRLVTKAKGLVAYPVWSPGADSIRFTLMTSQSEQLWQVNADGTHLHEVFPDWRDHQPEAGVWTAGGKYFVLTAGVAGTRDLWTIPTERRFLETSAPSAVRLTPGPMKAYLPQASPDGHRIFFQGQLSSAELVRYDSKLDSWATYLGGLPATQVEFSQDGKWIVYARPPERSIWRRSASGSDGLQLSDPALTCLNPRWSPDGKLITFTGARIGESSRLYVVPAAGGEVRQLTSGADGSKSDNDGNWSPDGATLVFGAQFGDPSVEDRKRLALETVDLQTGRIARLPGTEGLWSPRRSPDQRYIAAMGLPNRLWLYEVETGKRTLLTKIGAGWPCWSRDSQYVYFQDTPGTDWYRVSIKDARAERVMSLAGLKMDSNGLGWVGLTPDGATIATRDAGGTEIYGLDWEWQ
jgi:Tol biopolymer transport system component